MLIICANNSIGCVSTILHSWGKCITDVIKYISNNVHLDTETRHLQAQSTIEKGNAACRLYAGTKIVHGQTHKPLQQRNEMKLAWWTIVQQAFSNQVIHDCVTIQVMAFATNLWVRLGKIPDTHYPYPNYPNPDPNYPNPRYPILNSDSDFDYPKLVWVIRVISLGTQTTRTTQRFVFVFVFIMCC
jgi:hypothetical protein